MSATTIVKQFNPPGYLQDFDEKQKAQWSNFISETLDQVIIGYPDEYENDGPRFQFFNPSKVAPSSDLTSKKISWVGFPKIVKIHTSSDAQRWKKADSSRNYQDEYCEWSVTRNADNKIVNVTFTCEGPEYWQFLAETSPDKAVSLYQKYIHPSVKKEDLFDDKGKYQPVNIWNNTNSGAMHLIQPNNTLGAEMELAGGSSVVREINGKILTEQQELIKCGTYGQPERNSDPFIGSEVNALARLGARVSLLDPVGLYFDTFETPGWKVPGGEDDPTSFWKILRGTSEFPVRASFEVPKEKNYVVGDIEINGKKIEYGSQIADFVKIKLTGIAQDFGKVELKPLKACRVHKESPHLGLLSLPSEKPLKVSPTRPKLITRSTEEKSVWTL